MKEYYNGPAAKYDFALSNGQGLNVNANLNFHKFVSLGGQNLLIGSGSVKTGGRLTLYSDPKSKIGLGLTGSVYVNCKFYSQNNSFAYQLTAGFEGPFLQATIPLAVFNKSWTITNVNIIPTYNFQTRRYNIGFSWTL